MSYAQTILDNARNFEHTIDIADTQAVKVEEVIEGFHVVKIWTFADGSALSLIDSESHFGVINHE